MLQPTHEHNLDGADLTEVKIKDTNQQQIL